MAELIAGRFALVDPIGHGASGAVWRAFDTREQRYCAAKLVRAGDAETLLRVAHEQGVRLNHPHVASPYSWVADDRVLIAMDLVRGGSLATLIRDHGPLPAPYVTRILGQLLAVLGHVHGAGLLHRDVKPVNVLLEATGTGAPHCRLSDFGIAQPLGGPRLTETGYLVGTRGYLPPETLAGAPPDPRRDLYATGVVGWQLLTGAENPPDTVPDTGLAGVPEPLAALLLDLTAADPDRRPPDAAAGRRLAGIAARLPAAIPAWTVDGEPVEVFDAVGPLPQGWGPAGRVPDGAPAALGHPPGPTSGFGARRHRLLIAALLGVLVLAGGAAAAVAWSSSTPNTEPQPTASGPSRTGGPRSSDSVTATPTSPAPSSTPSRSSPVHSPRSAVRIGGTCGWQDVGTTDTTAEGRQVRCTYTSGGRYVWRPAR